MSITASASLSSRKKADVLFLPFFHEKGKAKPAFAQKGHTSLFSQALASGDFTGKKEEICLVSHAKGKEERVLLVGLGSEKDCTEETLRRSYGKAVVSLRGKKVKAASVCLPLSDKLMGEEVARAVSEGCFLASWAFDTYKKEKVSGLLRKWAFVQAYSPELAVIKEVHTVVDSVNFTRNLAISNADEITPTRLAHEAKEVAKGNAKMKVTVIGRKQFDKEKLFLLQAVSRGASEEPALIVLEYWGGKKGDPVTALVGKGVTYDTGGLNLKPTGFMETQREDMTGGATVLGVMRAVKALKLPINLVVAIGATENAIGPKSYKPGDVYKSRAGISVEITNTDAEGRLVLADALAYVQDIYQPKKIIDIATLTGGAIIALGEETAALMSNDDKFAKEIEKAGDETYERVWRMPLHDEYKDYLQSEFADIKNCGDRKASSVTAAIFLKQFIRKASWAHIDIAGVTFPDGKRRPYNTEKITGFGVRLILQVLRYEMAR